MGGGLLRYSMLPPLAAMRRAPTTTVVLFFESWLCLAARGRVVVLRPRLFVSCDGVVVQAAEFLAATPAPGLTASLALLEAALGVQATRKDIVTRVVFQGPTFTVGTLLGIP